MPDKTNNHMLTKVEQRGLEPVPDDQRNGTPGQLFWVWFAANISILGIPLGATLISLGLNVWQSVIVTAIGSFGSFALVGIISVAGRRGGAPSLEILVPQLWRYAVVWGGKLSIQLPVLLHFCHSSPLFLELP